MTEPARVDPPKIEPAKIEPAKVKEKVIKPTGSGDNQGAQGDNFLSFASLSIIGSLPEFSGIRGTLAVREFVGKIQQAKALVPTWDDATALRIAKLKITGPAREFIAANEETTPYKTFEDLSKALIKQYSVPEDISTLQVELSQMNQMANESVRTWGARIKGIGAKLLRVSGKMDTAFLQNLLKVRFEQGLRNPDFRRYIRWKDCPTLDNAIEITAQEEVRDRGTTHTPLFLMERESGTATYRGVQRRGGPKHDHQDFRKNFPRQEHQESQRNFPHQGSKGAPVTCWKCGRFGHMSRECRAQQETRSCYGCGQRGHLARNCPTKRQGLVNRSSFVPSFQPRDKHISKNGENPSPRH